MHTAFRKETHVKDKSTNRARIGRPLFPVVASRNQRLFSRNSISRRWVFLTSSKANVHHYTVTQIHANSTYEDIRHATRSRFAFLTREKRNKSSDICTNANANEVHSRVINMARCDHSWAWWLEGNFCNCDNNRIWMRGRNILQLPHIKVIMFF